MTGNAAEPRPAESTATDPLGFLPWVAAVLAFALALRIPALNAGLWVDEIETLVAFTRLPVFEIPFALESQNNHVLYTLAAWVTTTLFGESAWSLRLPAVLFGVASIWAVVQLGRELGTPRQGVLAAVLIAASSHHVFFSQSARGYTALMFTATFATVLLLRLLRAEKPVARGPWVLYVILLLATCMAHLTGGAVVAVHGAIGLVAWIRGRGQGRSVVLGTVAAGVLVVLWLLPGLESLMVGLGGEEEAAVSGSEWVTLGWLIRETLAGLSAGVPGGWLGIVAGSFVGGVGLVSMVRRDSEAAVAMVLPPVLILGALVATSHNLWPRFFFFAMGFVVLFAVRGVDVSLRTVLGGRGPRVTAALLLLAALGSTLTVPSVWVPKQDYEGAAAWFEEEGLASDEIAYLSFVYYGFLEYLGAPGTRVDSLEQLRTMERASDRMVVVYTLPENLRLAQPALWDHVQQSYDEVRVFPAGVAGAEIVILESYAADRGPTSEES
ncbi:MAG: hypothetical protein HKN71_02900 [Gemmatimonadetes bacterium]|nr:hypothetical protein [Gemmatimonadota bacterium]